MADKPEEMNFPKILFFHINRILQMAAIDRLMFISYIDVFEDVLVAYLTPEYTDNVEKERQKMLTEMELKPPFALGEELDKKVGFARAKFRELMRIAEKNRLLLIKVSRDEVWELPEDSDNVEE